MDSGNFQPNSGLETRICMISPNRPLHPKIINMRMKGQMQPVYAKYESFEIGDEASKYTLKISGVSGNASHLTGSFSFSTFHNNTKFSTYDQDNDLWSSGDCSNTYGRTGWWFDNCYNFLLTSNYKFTDRHGEIYWYDI